MSRLCLSAKRRWPLFMLMRLELPERECGNESINTLHRHQVHISFFLSYFYNGIVRSCSNISFWLKCRRCRRRPILTRLHPIPSPFRCLVVVYHVLPIQFFPARTRWQVYSHPRT
ncbi:hypothetical protein ARMGADRAFT_217097 [Armillaria gallica]|uniref:Uncharacterized protein n=1 Tax=Armillaria gallica TaxID=47427 RepID=A0A2H3CUT3_ARMGA|nr:hypothetical protein ARMGADRAFT_219718 [Armillaria gallica]PBK79088.1 hypothetical protein ARMGADRAFT_217097 [Armillaria gallica]